MLGPMEIHSEYFYNVYWEAETYREYISGDKLIQKYPCPIVLPPH